MKEWRMPAEWEPQAFVQLTWPHADTDWQPMLDEITETYVQMADAITAKTINDSSLRMVSPFGFMRAGRGRDRRRRRRSVN